MFGGVGDLPGVGSPTASGGVGDLPGVGSPSASGGGGVSVVLRGESMFGTS